MLRFRIKLFSFNVSYIILKKNSIPKGWYGRFIGKNDRNQAFFMKKKELQIDHADLTKAVAEQN